MISAQTIYAMIPIFILLKPEEEDPPPRKHRNTGQRVQLHKEVKAVGVYRKLF